MHMNEEMKVREWRKLCNKEFIICIFIGIVGMTESRIIRSAGHVILRHV